MTNPTPPVAAKRPHTMTLHDHTRVDDYYWLREKSNPEVIAYLEAENAYMKAMTAHTEDLQEKVYQEMVGRIQETDLTVPERKGDYVYYSRTEEGQQYSIYCRRPVASDEGSEDDEEVLLDLNQLAEGHEYLRMGIYKVSPDHNLLAYSLDTNGSEDYTIYFKDLRTGQRLPDEIPNTTYSAEWGNDNQTLFYTTQDHAKRAYKCWRHRLGDPVGQDDELYHEADELFRVYIFKTRDEAYLVLALMSIETSEMRFLDADDPAGNFNLVHPRQEGMRYFLDHHSGTFYILTNDDAKNFKLMTTPVATPGREHWQELVPHREDVKIDDIDLFAYHLVRYERANGLRTLHVTNLGTGQGHDVTFPEPVYTYGGNANPEFNTNLLRFTYMSLTTPDSVYDYNMDTRERELKKRKPVLGGYDPADYQSERLFATARDGTQVPISLVYKKGMEPRPDAPRTCVLYGYGSYGFSTDPSFNSNRFSLIDRGVMFAIAHIRGGQEMGRHWYDQGKFLNKKNTFTDFIDCGRHLIAQGYTTSEQLVIYGGSAGGLLVGAVLNMAPDLCRVAVAAVPFVDVVTTMLDESIPLTVGEFEEWGNPKEKTYYEYMLSYSPYDNVTPRAYPNILVTAGLNDPRVQYWEPAKWTAKLRTLKTDESTLLLKTNMGAGHAGASGRYDYLRELAFDYTFMLDQLGIDR